MNVTLPDGTLLEGVPNGATKADIIGRLQRNGYDVTKLVQQAGGEMALQDMGTAGRVAAGAGRAVANLGRGVSQLFGNTSTAEIDEAKARDKALLSSGAGMAGNLAGNIGIAAPAMLVPGANTYLGATALGTALGAAEPVGTGDNRLLNTAGGAVGGAVGQGVGNLVGRAISPLANRRSPEERALVQAAKRENIPLTAGDVTGSRPMQVTESVLENMPFTAGPQLDLREAKQRAFTAAGLRRAGMQGDAATPQELGTQKSLLGSELGNIANRHSINFNQGTLTNDLTNIVDDAARHLPPDSAARVAHTVDQILAQVDKTGTLSGTNYQGWRQPLRDLAADTREGRYFRQVRSALDDAFKSQIQGSDAASFSKASREYANLKTLLDAMGGQGNLPATGQLSPAQLGQALARSMGREGKALGRGDMNELARVGQLLVKEQIPNSGTAQRQLMSQLLTGSTLGGIGGGVLGASGGDGVNWRGGMSGAMAGAGAGLAGGLALPRAVQSVINSRAGQAYLRHGIVPLTEAERRALTNALRTITVGAQQSRERE